MALRMQREATRPGAAGLVQPKPNRVGDRLVALVLLMAVVTSPATAAPPTLEVPAVTAYTEPNPYVARMTEDGMRRWARKDVTVKWFGRFKNTGQVDATVRMRLPESTDLKLQMTVADQTSVATVSVDKAGAANATFPNLQISQPGYHDFALRLLDETPVQGAVLEALVLSGPAVEGAHFNLKSRRNAASVHLAYPYDRKLDVAAFYCEVTGLEDPLHTYYMACGWHRGYLGMQVISPTERRIIFSVWDSGNEAIDRDKVAAQDRVTLVDKGEDVYSGDFGNEGTGGHSHLKFNWETGQRQRFVVTAEPVDATHTIFSGYYYRRDQQSWMLISSWKAPKEGGYLRGLYSFSENFVGANGHLLRKARYGNVWIKTADGAWQALTRATFSHDPTGREDRLDRFMGVEAGDWFLSHGGFTEGSTPFGTPFDLPAARSKKPRDLPAAVESLGPVNE